MGIQIVSTIETFLANAAEMWSITRVSFFVPNEVTLITESFSTNLKKQKYLLRNVPIIIHY